MRHEALLYAGEQEFLDGTLPFIRDGVAAQEPVLVLLGADKIELLRSELDGEAAGVRFADIDGVGHNPARIIPVWRDFLSEHPPARPVRGIGEPIPQARGPAELTECHRHESLLNLAFAESSKFWLLCPYDTSALDPAVIEEAQRNHPFIADGGGRRQSESYGGLERAAAPFDEPLPEPPVRPHELVFDGHSLGALRTFASLCALDAGLDPDTTDDLVLAVNEVAANSVLHADGGGTLRVWQEGETLVYEVRDRGRIDRPLAGRERPAVDKSGGCGLWLANHLCDLVQIRTFADGSAVRLHKRLA
jgi:anti-sigma regulatory factor (Ser/Thr protein kinase)